MRINKKWTESIQDNVLISTDQKTTTVTYDDIKTNAESIISWLGHSKMIFDTKDNSDTLPHYLQYLEAKIDASRKTATFWDAYKITGVVKNIDEFNQKYGVLPNNSGLIIDAPITIDANHSYNQGDVVYKDFYGNQLCAKAQVGGVFKPNSITNKTDENGNSTNTFLMNFIYIEQVTNEKVELEIPDVSSSVIEKVYNNILNLQPKGNTKDKADLNLIQTTDGNYITPVWEVRLATDDDTHYGEKVFGAVSVSYSNGQVHFQNNSPFSLVVIIK